METEERSSVLWRLERFIDVFCINNVTRGGGKGEREGGSTTGAKKNEGEEEWKGRG